MYSQTKKTNDYRIPENPMIYPSCHLEILDGENFSKNCSVQMESGAASPIRTPQATRTFPIRPSNPPDVNAILKTARMPPPQFKKPLHYIWICDCSESMQNGGKMSSVNAAIPQAIQSICEFEETVKKASIYMNALKFSCGARWMYADNIPVKSFVWENLPCEGITDLGQAFLLLAKSLKLQSDGGKMPEKAYPPVLVLISDGYPTDDWETGLSELNKEFWAQNAVRLAFSLDGADREVLQAFIGDVVDKDKKLIEITDLKKLASEIKANTTTYGMQKIRDRMPPPDR